MPKARPSIRANCRDQYSSLSQARAPLVPEVAADMGLSAASRETLNDGKPQHDLTSTPNPAADIGLSAASSTGGCCSAGCAGCTAAGSAPAMDPIMAAIAATLAVPVLPADGGR